MDKPWGLEKKSASEWEDLYWQSIKRYPEMNSKFMKQQEEIASLWQTVNKLTNHIHTLDGFTEQYFNVVGQTIYFDFVGLRARLVSQRQLIDTIKTNYRTAVQMNAELRDENERLKREGEQRPSLQSSRYW